MFAYTRLAMATFIIVLAPLAAAETLTEVSTRVCENVRQCVLAEIGEADMTPQMREMMMPMVDSMCDAVRQGIEEVPAGHPLYAPALACMQSLVNLSCDDFRDGDTVQTPACKAYQAQVEAAYAQ